MNAEELARWFEANKTLLETAYLAAKDPWQQSGSSIGKKTTVDEWTAKRRCIADCMERPGTFLDVGCANGYLMECVVQWTAERGITIDPYGLDFSEKLVAFARQRLPQYADHFYIGNAWDWTPPRMFDYVRTELVYVPDELYDRYTSRLLEQFVAPGGALLAVEYSPRDKPNIGLDIDHYLERRGFTVEATKTAFWDGVEKTRAAVIRKQELS
jgi:SAM-dependent methyltransferase